MTPRACRCGHWPRAHRHLPGAEGCGRCPCRAFRPPRVVTHRDWVLRAMVAAVVLLGLAAATALLATRGSGDGETGHRGSALDREGRERLPDRRPVVEQQLTLRNIESHFSARAPTGLELSRVDR